MAAHLDEHMLLMGSPCPELIDEEDLTQDNPLETVHPK